MRYGASRLGWPGLWVAAGCVDFLTSPEPGSVWSDPADTVPVVDTGVRAPAAAAGRRFAAWDALSPPRAGPSWALAVADVDGDGDLDLYSGNHADNPSLYLNDGRGRLTDVGAVWGIAGTHDAHGAVFVDLDRDGDLDLLEVTGAQSGGGVGANRAWMVDGVSATDAAAALGLQYPLGSGRMPVPADLDGDGRLDVVLINQVRTDGLGATTLLTAQADGTFEELAPSPPELSLGAATGGAWVDADGDGVMEVVQFQRSGGVVAMRATGGALVDVSPQVGLPTTSWLADLVIADLTNDGLRDVYLSRWREVSQLIVGEDARSLQLALLVTDEPEGVRFRSDGRVVVNLQPPWTWSAFDIRIGGRCLSTTTASVVLQADDPLAEGTCAAIVAGSQRGLSIGRLADGTWEVVLRSDGFDRGNVEVLLDAPATEVASVGFTEPTESEASATDRDRLWVAAPGGGLSDDGWSRGFQTPTRCDAVVAADFDNDMDLDLFFACSGPALNTPDQLWINDGAGHFAPLLGHGAEGGTAGRSDAAVAADLDGDGWLDLVVGNGNAAPPFNAGPLSVFRNVGGDAHWLAVDVRDAQGAPAHGVSVEVEAGGVLQLRDAAVGVHRGAFALTPLHVGLGPHPRADRVVVRWPDGVQVTLLDVQADAVLRVDRP